MRGVGKGAGGLGLMLIFPHGVKSQDGRDEGDEGDGRDEGDWGDWGDWGDMTNDK
jgi:hypothetical protein